MQPPKVLSLSMVLLFIVGGLLTGCGQESNPAAEIIEKNIAAAGGKEALEGIMSYSFSFGTSTFYMSTDGRMKRTEGSPPIVTEAVLVNADGVKRNCFNNLSEFSGLEKATYTALARLRAGLFTLAHFHDDLQLEGLKSFGPQQLHHLSTAIDDLQVDFYIDAGTYLLKRLVLTGYDPESGKYEVNHDYGPYQEIGGIKIPTSWFSSQVGARGSEFQVEDVVLNPDLSADFFSTVAINVGDTEITPGALKGRIIEFSFQRGRLMLASNWTEKCVKGAGFVDKEILSLVLQDREIDITFYASRPPREAMGQGTKIMLPNFRSENFIIYLMSPEYEELAESLEILMPIQLKKK